MRTGNPHPSPRERGQVIVLLMLVFVGLLGITGVAVDGGRLYSQRRSAQNAADSAALAAAFAICGNPAPSNPSAAAQTAGVASAAQNGFAVAPPNVTVTVLTPPSSGAHAGDDEYVSVAIMSRVQLTLGRLVYSGTPEIRASAVARCTRGGAPIGGGNGLIALNDAQHSTIELAPSGCIKVFGGGIFVNSSHSQAVNYHSTGTGCDPRLRGDWIRIVGGYTIPSWMTPSAVMSPFPPQTGVPPMSDPLSTVPVPTVPGAPSTPSPDRCGSTIFMSGRNLVIRNGWVNCATINVYPGLYDSICIGADARVTMHPGLYYITGNSTCGGDIAFVADGSGIVNGNGVMLFLADRGIHVGGSGSVTLTAPTTGPYAGMAIFLERDNGSDIRVDGAGVTLIRGTIYAPNSLVSMAGSGTNKTLNAQLIAWRYYVSGGGSITVNYDPGVVFGGGGASRIELSE